MLVGLYLRLCNQTKHVHEAENRCLCIVSEIALACLAITSDIPTEALVVMALEYHMNTL